MPMAIFWWEKKIEMHDSRYWGVPEVFQCSCVPRPDSEVFLLLFLFGRNVQNRNTLMKSAKKNHSIQSSLFVKQMKKNISVLETLNVYNKTGKKTNDIYMFLQLGHHHQTCVSYNLNRFVI